MTTRELDLSTQCVNDRERLVEAYHMLFDVKDHCFESEEVRIKLFNAISAVGDALMLLGYHAPSRFDGMGR